MGACAGPLIELRSEARSAPATPCSALQARQQQAQSRLALLPVRQSPQRAAEMRVRPRSGRGACRHQRRRLWEPPYLGRGLVRGRIHLEDHPPMIRESPPEPSMYSLFIGTGWGSASIGS